MTTFYGLDALLHSVSLKTQHPKGVTSCDSLFLSIDPFHDRPYDSSLVTHSNHTRIRKSASGIRLYQNNTLLSHLRIKPGPTHELFDVLAACLFVLSPGQSIAALGFAAGGFMAPLRGMYGEHHIHGIDLDSQGWDLFSESTHSWNGHTRFTKADACKWLRQSRKKYDAILEDLSAPQGRDIVKPTVCWTELPSLCFSKLKPQGIMIANFFPPLPVSWKKLADCLSLQGKHPVTVIHLDDYHNRIFIIGDYPYTTRDLSTRLMCALDIVHSRQADRFSLRKIKTTV